MTINHKTLAWSPLLALLSVLALTASPAIAAQTRLFTGAFGCEEGVAGCTVAERAVPDPYPLAADPWSTAVNDTTGDVYVTDAANYRVQEFNSKGEFVLMFGKAVNFTEVMVHGGADAEAEDVCTAASFDACQPGTASSAPGGFEGSLAMFVAVDNSSSGASKGDVYVGVFNEHVAAANRVSKFDSSGQLVSSWGESGEIVGGGAEAPFGEIFGIAVDPSGNLWVAAGGAAFEFGQEAKLETDWAWPLDGGGITVSPGPFGVAVDSQDDLYVLVGGEGVIEVTGAGVLVGRVTEPGEQAHPMETSGVAVDPATNALYVSDRPGGSEPLPVQLQRYELPCSGQFKRSSCTAAETFTNGHLTVESVDHGLAINPSPSKSLYVTSRTTGEVRTYSIVTVPGVSTVKPSSVSATAATLNGTVNPSGVPVTKCYFEYGLTESYGKREPCASLPGSGTLPVEVHATIGAPPAGESYHYRLVAANANDLEEPEVGKDLVFGPPVIDSESSASVTATTAELKAAVSSRNLDTRVRLEYGTTAGYGKSASEEAVVAGASGEQVVGFELRGLAAGTEYHYRFVAENALGEGVGAVLGSDRVFTTEGEGAFRLPDGRGWELVSPRDRHGASIEPLGSAFDTGGQIQASGVGGGVTYVTSIPTESGVRGLTEFGQVLSVRGGGGAGKQSPSGWVSKDLSVPHSAGFQTGVSFDTGREYRLFSEDLSVAAVQPEGGFAPCVSALGAPQPCISPEASEQTSFLEDTGTGLFTPLVTGCPSPLQEEEGHPCPTAVSEHANVPPGTVFGQHVVTGPPNTCPGHGVLCGPYFEDATPDFAHVVVDSYARLTEEPGAQGGLYEWTGGKLVFVGAGRLGDGDKETTDYRHAISEDGSRVFWTSTVAHEEHLFMRDTATGELLQLDVIEEGCVAKGKCVTGAVGPEFQFASSEGNRVFFTDSQQLTADSGASGNGARADGAKPDLYECVIEEVAGKPACDLTDLTPVGAGGEAAGVQGVLPGASEDGSYVYFVANGVLENNGTKVAGAVSGDCEVNQEKAPGQLCNLYVWHDGVTKLVAVLSGVDEPDWGGTYLGAPTARVSPDGRYLAFMSNRSLTGYDNADAVSGEPDEEVYLYDASTEKLVCASCDPTGARPHGREYGEQYANHLENTLVGSLKGWYSKTWLAANIPTWTPQTYDNAIYQSRYLSDEGRLFFNTGDGLVPKDVNEQQDVYEYEPQGVPAPAPEASRCGPAAGSGSEVYKPAHTFESEPPKEGEPGLAGEEGTGCVALISSGTSGEESAFMDASAGSGVGEHGAAGSAGGGDVFFLSAAHLVGGEIEGGESLYDAHECTAGSPCSQEAQTPPECTTAEGCRAAPEPQPSIYSAPSSATFNGLGNPAPEVVAPAVKKVVKKTVKCKRGFVKNKHGKCVRKPKPKQHGKAKR
jgi:hypothetical protein